MNMVRGPLWWGTLGPTPLRPALVYNILFKGTEFDVDLSRNRHAVLCYLSIIFLYNDITEQAS